MKSFQDQPARRSTAPPGVTYSPLQWLSPISLCMYVCEKNRALSGLCFCRCCFTCVCEICVCLLACVICSLAFQKVLEEQTEEDRIPNCWTNSRGSPVVALVSLQECGKPSKTMTDWASTPASSLLAFPRESIISQNVRLKEEFSWSGTTPTACGVPEPTSQIVAFLLTHTIS